MSDDSGSDAFMSFGLRDAFLNAPLIEAFMDGIYTMVFIYTMSMMFTKPKFLSNNKWLLTALVVLYILTMSHLGIQWSLTRESFITHGDTADTILNDGLFGTHIAMSMGSGTVSTAATILADSILVWRCWIIWNRDWKAILLPVMTLLAELATGIYSLYLQVAPLATDNVTADPSTIYLALSLVTTVLSTVLIVFRIVRLGSFSQGSPHKNVIEIVVESAALYSLALILFLPLYVQTDLRLNFMSEYLKRVVVGMTGIAPTLIVARVAMGVARPNSSWSHYGNTSQGGLMTSGGSQTKFSSMPPMMSTIEVKRHTDSITSSV